MTLLLRNLFSASFFCKKESEKRTALFHHTCTNTTECVEGMFCDILFLWEKRVGKHLWIEEEKGIHNI